MSCNRPSRAAAEIQNLCSCRQSIDKEVMPHFIVPGAVLTVAVPRRGVSLVVLYDAACEVRHAADMGARHGRSRRALRVRYCPMTQCVLKGCGSRARERAAMCPSPSPPPLLPHWQFSGRQNPGGPIERTSELLRSAEHCGLLRGRGGFIALCRFARDQPCARSLRGEGRRADPGTPIGHRTRAQNRRAGV